jgi:hypothetical protein
MIKKILLVLTVTIFSFVNGFAQNPDFALSQAEKDSLLKNYNQIFPFWGRNVIEKGFDIPYPVGVNANYIYMDQGILIDNLGLSFGDNPTVPMGDFIKFGDNRTVINSVNARFDLWVFPFLNLYGMIGEGWSSTTVNLTDPIGLKTTVDQKGAYYGFGATTAVGYKKTWISFDGNVSWTDLEKLEDPVQVFVGGIRVGQTFRVMKTHRLAIWAGAMYQKFDTGTQGSVKLSEVLPGTIHDKINNIPNQPGFDELPDRVKDAILGIIDDYNNRYDNAKLNYSIDKGPETPWNLLFGANYEFTKAWQLRAEAGLIGRWSLLINLNYRFAL